MSDSPRHAFPVIGLTGSIGAGKTLVAEILASLGCLVSDSDALARAALADPAIRAQLVAWWGSTVLNSQGEINRSAVASIIFAAPSATTAQQAAAKQDRLRLEALSHPWIALRRNELFAAALPSTKALVIEAPLLLESAMQDQCDAIWMVDAPFSLRLERVKASREWPEAELRRREIVQMPLDLKRKLAHDVLINDSSVESLRAQVARILSLTLEKHQGKQRA